jgi:hypothetical protein
VRAEAEHAVRDAHRDSAFSEAAPELLDRQPAGRQHAQDAGASRWIRRPQALEASLSQARLERVDPPLRMREDRFRIEELQQPYRGVQAREPDGVLGAALEDVGGLAERPVVPQVPRALEQEAERLLVREPAGEVGPQRRRPLGRHVHEARALGAHEPLVAATRQVVDAGRHIERHGTHGLDRVDEQLGAMRVAERGHLLPGHAESGLELHRADGHEPSPAPQLGLEPGESVAAPVAEAVEGEQRDREAEQLRRALPRGHVGGELAGETQNSVPCAPGEAQRDVDDAGGGVGRPGDVCRSRADERGEPPTELLAKVPERREGGHTARGGVVERRLHRRANGERRRRDGAVVRVDPGSEVGEEAAVTEARRVVTHGGAS